MKIGNHSLKISLFVLAANCAALTWADIVMTGSGDYSYKISADASLAGQKMIVDSNASVLKYPGIFAPNSGEKKKVFRNVKLSDIVSFKARIGTQDRGGEPWSWIESTMFHDSGDSRLVSGERTCQLQVLRNANHIIGFSLKFEQDGNDVNCFIEYAKYAFNQDEQFFGCDLNNKGVYLKVLEEEHVSGQSDAYKYGGAAIADIECVLKDEAEVLMAPSAIVFENTDDTIPEETVTDNSFLSVNKEIIFKNVNTADVVAVSAEMGSTQWLGPDWIVANCYHRTNRTEGLEFQLQAHTTKSTHGIYCVFILLTQRGSDLCAKVICSGYPAITACRAYQENIGYRFHYDNGGGTPVDLLDTMNTDSYENINPHKMAVRNLSITYRPRKRVVAVYDDCIMKEWVKLWPDTRLSDIEHGIAMMGGHGAGSVWLNVLSYLPEEITDVFYYNSNITKRYYQAQKGTSVRSIRVGFRQQDDDVWAKVYAVTYRYPNPFAFPLDGLKDDEYKSAIANTVDGKSEDANIENTLSLCGLSAVRQARVRHTVTVDPSFNASKLPVRLHEICLDVSVPADATEALTDKISGYSGAVAKTGAGTLSLDTDICGSMDLEVLSGTVSVASPREIAGKLIVANGATLSFDFTSEEQAYIGAQNASFAPGATVCVKLPDLPTGIEDGTMIKIIKGCELAPESISGVRFALQGGNAQVKAGLTVDADGDIAVLFRTVGGLIISIR